LKPFYLSRNYKLISLFMAKVKFSAIVSDMRGKLNGSVFAKNRGGNYLRTKVTPSNPQTIAQQAARSLLTTYSQGWRALTEDQRSSWNNAVSNWTGTDIFGDIKTPTGLQLYIRLNVNVSLAGSSPLTLPPLAGSVPAIENVDVTVDASPQTLTIVGDPDPIPAGYAMYMEGTPGLSPGISNANSRFRFFQLVPAGAWPAAFITDYTTKFGAVVAGQKYFFRLKLINITTGQVSQAVVASGIAS
jgi:hypothetical protein